MYVGTVCLGILVPVIVFGTSTGTIFDRIVKNIDKEIVQHSLMLPKLARIYH